VPTRSGSPAKRRDDVKTASGELSTETVHNRLRDGILRGEFDPRVPISQVQLAARLGVSRTPLREALRMLQREGLIESEPNRRVRVAELSVSELEQLYAARIVVEALTTRVAVSRLDAEDLAELRSLLREMSVLAGKRNIDEWDVRHRAYHELLKVRVGGRLARITRELFDHTERYRHVYLAEPRAWTTAAEEHQAILSACEAGDAILASHHVGRHLGRTALTIIAAVDAEHDPVPVREALRIVMADESEGQPGSL
jgi:DNA-binding GntR family transcriptional regulator